MATEKRTREIVRKEYEIGFRMRKHKNKSHKRDRVEQCMPIRHKWY